MSLLNRFAPALLQDVNRAFALLEDPFFNNARRVGGNLPLFEGSSAFRPNVDVSETEKAYVVEAEVPGMRKEDLDIEFLDDNTLVLKGKVERSRRRDLGASSQQASETPQTVNASGEPAPEGETPVTTETAVATESAKKAVAEPTVWNSERITGTFQRSFQFPSRIDPEAVKAIYEDGILTVTVPKSERRRQKVSIEVA